MMQYMFAETIKEYVPKCIIANVNLPYWNKELIDVSEENFIEAINIHEHSEINFDQLSKDYSARDQLKIDLTGFFQRLELFPELNKAKNLFKTEIKPIEIFSDEDLIINIRAGEIISGQVSWYPILPISYYEYLVDLTGLNPVFVGQLDDNAYTDQIKRTFPNARLLPSKGAIYDFQLVRSAKNICICVSTFSWLAAWLSEAKQIFYPMAGFLSPALQRCYEQYIAPTNLAPIDDKRYRFFSMPLFYNEPLAALLEHHKTLRNSYSELQTSTVRNIKEHAPFKPAKSQQTIIVDHKWYVKSYPKAAIEISEGWYDSPRHHFAEAGIAQGYKPFEPKGYESIYPNITADKITSQSSISEWSFESSIRTDSQRVINGNLLQVFGCHTSIEDFPWWEIDLTEIYNIDAIKIYNRYDDVATAARLFPFSIKTSLNVEEFETVYQYSVTNDDVQLIQNHNVIDVKFLKLHASRAVRITAESQNGILNLCQVQIFGSLARDVLA